MRRVVVACAFFLCVVSFLAADTYCTNNNNSMAKQQQHEGIESESDTLIEICVISDRKTIYNVAFSDGKGPYHSVLRSISQPQQQRQQNSNKIFPIKLQKKIET